MDPGIVTGDSWAGISDLMRALWLLLPLVVVFGGSLLLSLAVIPSLVTSGELPARAEKLRAPLYFVAAVAFVAYLVALGAVVQAAGIIDRFWPRWWI
ncbi:MAG: hypothetical protein HYY01_12055 [Chloroflexi bacterium]|nr:hypothetical protein [Chloroflexota bacterium]